MGRAGRTGTALLISALCCACGAGTGTPPVSSLSLGNFQSADVVFGQPIFAYNQSNQGKAGPGADTLSAGGKPALAGLFLPDANNHRVLGFHATPVISNLSASFVLGQPSFTYSGAAVGSTAMNTPRGAAVDAGFLFVADQGNNRILVWSGIPDGNGTPASFALGQPDLISKAPGAGPAGMSAPSSVAAAGGRLAVADSLNNRVLVWDRLPAAGGVPADRALGQPDFDAVLPNGGAEVGPLGLSNPVAVWTDGTILAVVDKGNHRILVWRRWPDANGIHPDLVLGQEEFDTAEAGAGASGCNAPSDVTCNDSQFFVADAGNNRVLIWNHLPTRNHTPADRVIGQGDFDHVAPNDDDQDGVEDDTCSARSLSGGETANLSVHVAGTDLFVGDSGNHRLLIFRSR